MAFIYYKPDDAKANGLQPSSRLPHGCLTNQRSRCTTPRTWSSQPQPPPLYAPSSHLPSISSPAVAFLSAPYCQHYCHPIRQPRDMSAAMAWPIMYNAVAQAQPLVFPRALVRENQIDGLAIGLLCHHTASRCLTQPSTVSSAFKPIFGGGCSSPQLPPPCLWGSSAHPSHPGPARQSKRASKHSLP